MQRNPGTGMPSDGTARSCRPLGSWVLLACVLAAVPPLAADEPPTTTLLGRQLDGRVRQIDPAPAGLSTWKPDPEAGASFYRDRLLPRFERQFGRLGQYRWTAHVNQGVSENVLREEVTEAARRGFERATQRAIEDYLIEDTALRFLALSLDRRSRQPAPGGASRPSAVKVGLGISHGLPELELSTSIGRVPVKFELAADGEVGIGYRSPRSGRADLSARFDPADSRYSLSTRFSY